MIKSFKDYINDSYKNVNESYLNVDDIDDINSLSLKMFWKYLNYIFGGSESRWFFGFKKDVIFGDFGSVGFFIFHKNEEQIEVLYKKYLVQKHPKDADEMFDELDKKYKFEKVCKDNNGNDSSSGSEYIRISPIDDSPITNAFYLDVIDRFHETKFGLSHRVYHKRKDTDIKLKDSEGSYEYYKRKHKEEADAEEAESKKHIYAY